ncbi:MAG: hypothetical protein EPN20_09185 [Magnetospirillum sp.]|nr:MAG: hypothetical protein EPN20_09185 [Magnetospirillum sp.]
MTEIEALILAVAVEGPVAYALVRLAGWSSRGPVHVGFASAVATAVTHPQFWAGALWAYRCFSYWSSILVGEALVVLVEAILIAWMGQLSLRYAMQVSLLANMASYFVGLVIIGR